AFTIHDMGGTDTIDYSDDTVAQRVDLTPEAISDVYGRIGNMVIARGTIIENYVAGSGDDSVTGNAANNDLRGGGGNDSLLGGGGNDTLNGGSGADVLDGGSGRDYASYASASVGVLADMLVTSVSTGEAVGDSFNGVEGLVGSALRDELRGDNLQNFLFAGASNDVLGGRGGNDHLYGEGGNDLLVGGAG